MEAVLILAPSLISNSIADPTGTYIRPYLALQPRWYIFCTKTYSQEKLSLFCVQLVNQECLHQVGHMVTPRAALIDNHVSFQGRLPPKVYSDSLSYTCSRFAQRPAPSFSCLPPGNRRPGPSTLLYTMLTHREAIYIVVHDAHAHTVTGFVFLQAPHAIE